jgi:cell fate (sporulation/competence/biofilm development) regulator YlbF (YheA/YmcA/DUF963 family)
MDDSTLNELEVASREVVMQAARQFAEAFAETTQYQAFQQAYFAYRRDGSAQKALREFQQKQASLKALQMLNALSQDDRQEIQRLQDQFYGLPSVVAYTQAQETLVAFSQNIGDQLSEAIGLDYGSSCQTGGCCG